MSTLEQIGFPYLSEVVFSKNLFLEDYREGFLIKLKWTIDWEHQHLCSVTAMIIMTMAFFIYYYCLQYNLIVISIIYTWPKIFNSIIIGTRVFQHKKRQKERNCQLLQISLPSLQSSTLSSQSSSFWSQTSQELSSRQLKRKTVLRRWDGV